MESMIQYPPGDPRVVDRIVSQLKSQGIFDRFRKECIADVDTKPAYQNLHQRVEGTVTAFLATQEWRSDLNKNQLRDSLRKHIHESGFLDIGVERIVDQVVNPKISTVLLPQIEDVVYNLLGLEKPKKPIYSQHVASLQSAKNFKPIKMATLEDLLPKDLDPISPGSVGVGSDDDLDMDKKKAAADEEEEGEEKDEEESSPPFEPIEKPGVGMPDENSLDSHLSGISGLTSHDSQMSNVSFKGEIAPATSAAVMRSASVDLANQDSQLSKVSSGSRLSIVFSDEQENPDQRISPHSSDMDTQNDDSLLSKSPVPTLHEPQAVDSTGERALESDEAGFIPDAVVTRESMSDTSNQERQPAEPSAEEVQEYKDSEEKTIEEADNLPRALTPEEKSEEMEVVVRTEVEEAIELQQPQQQEVAKEAASASEEAAAAAAATEAATPPHEETQGKPEPQVEKPQEEAKPRKEDRKHSSASTDSRDSRRSVSTSGSSEGERRKDKDKGKRSHTDKHEDRKSRDRTRSGERDKGDKERKDRSADKEEQRVEEKVKEGEKDISKRHKTEDKAEGLKRADSVEKPEYKESKDKVEKPKSDRERPKHEEKDSNKEKGKSDEKVDKDVKLDKEAGKEKTQVNVEVEQTKEKSHQEEKGREKPKHEEKSDKETKEKSRQDDKAERENREKARHEDKSNRDSSREKVRNVEKHDKDSAKDKQKPEDKMEHKEKIRQDDRAKKEISKDKTKHDKSERESSKERSKHDGKADKSRPKHETKDDKGKTDDKNMKSDKEGAKDKPRKESTETSKSDKTDVEKRSRNQSESKSQSESRRDKTSRERSKHSSDRGKSRHDDRHKDTKSESKERESYRHESKSSTNSGSTGGEKTSHRDSKSKPKSEGKDLRPESKGKEERSDKKEMKKEERSSKDREKEKERERAKKSHSSSREGGDASRKEGSSSSHRNSSSSSRDARRRDGKSRSSDDHHSHRERRSDDRRSADRDSNGASRSHPTATASADSSHRHEQRSSGGSSSNTNSGGKTLEAAQAHKTEAAEHSVLPIKKRPVQHASEPGEGDVGEYSCTHNAGKLVLKLKKPKIAANIFEVRKIMHLRKSMAKIERKKQRGEHRLQAQEEAEVEEKQNRAEPSTSTRGGGDATYNPYQLQPQASDSSDEALTHFSESEVHCDTKFLEFIRKLESSETLSELSCSSDEETEYEARKGAHSSVEREPKAVSERKEGTKEEMSQRHAEKIPKRGMKDIASVAVPARTSRHDKEKGHEEAPVRTRQEAKDKAPEELPVRTSRHDMRGKDHEVPSGRTSRQEIKEKVSKELSEGPLGQEVQKTSRQDITDKVPTIRTRGQEMKEKTSDALPEFPVATQERTTREEVKAASISSRQERQQTPKVKERVAQTPIERSERPALRVYGRSDKVTRQKMHLRGSELDVEQTQRESPRPGGYHRGRGLKRKVQEQPSDSTSTATVSKVTSSLASSPTLRDSVTEVGEHSMTVDNVSELPAEAEARPHVELAGYHSSRVGRPTLGLRKPPAASSPRPELLGLGSGPFSPRDVLEVRVLEVDGDEYSSIKDNNNVDKSSSDDEKTGTETLSNELISTALRDLMMESGLSLPGPLSCSVSPPCQDPAEKQPSPTPGSTGSDSEARSGPRRLRPAGRARRLGLARPSRSSPLSNDAGKTSPSPSPASADFPLPPSPESDAADPGKQPSLVRKAGVVAAGGGEQAASRGQARPLAPGEARRHLRSEPAGAAGAGAELPRHSGPLPKRSLRTSHSRPPEQEPPTSQLGSEGSFSSESNLHTKRMRR